MGQSGLSVAGYSLAVPSCVARWPSVQCRPHISTGTCSFGRVARHEQETPVLVGYADRTWPDIFNYHGLNGKPSTWPFKRILSGSHYIIVGMGYYMRGKPGYRYADTKGVEILNRVGAHLAKHLKINKKQLFAGGFSKGGCYVHEMMIAAPRFWTGGIMLGGGSGGNRAKNSKDTAAISRKLIFIGCGGKDVHLKYADTAREYYTSLKASVTYEKWLGVGHTIDWKATKLSGWLMAVGPLKGAAAKSARTS